MRTCLPLLCLLPACAGLGERSVDVTEELVLDGAVETVVAPRTGEVLVVQDERLLSVDASLGRAPALITAGIGEVRDGLPVGEAVLLATDTRLLAWTDSGLVESPTTALLDTPAHALDAFGSRLALSTDGAIYLSDGGVLDELQVEGSAAVGTARFGPDGTLWLATQGGLLGWTSQGVHTFDPQATLDVAVTRTGDAWFTTGESVLLRARDGRVDAFKAPELPVAVHAAGEHVWVIGEQGAWRLDGRTLQRVYQGPVLASAADPSGRLLLSTDTEVLRLSIERPLVLDGIRPGQTLVGRTRLRLLPTAADQIDALSVTLDGEPLTLDEDRSVQIDPDTLPGGTHTLIARAAWDDGEEAEQSLTFSTSLVDSATWLADVEPLHRERCAVCHEGETATVIDGPQAWQDRYDDIWSAVSEARMPLGGASLSAYELAVVQAWQAAGFPLD